MMTESASLPAPSRVFERPATPPSSVPAPAALRQDELRDERIQNETDWEVLKDVATD